MSATGHHTKILRTFRDPLLRGDITSGAFAERSTRHETLATAGIVGLLLIETRLTDKGIARREFLGEPCKHYRSNPSPLKLFTLNDPEVGGMPLTSKGLASSSVMW